MATIDLSTGDRLFLVLALLIAAQTLVRVRGPGDLGRKLSSLALAYGLLIVGRVAFAERLGRPKPVAMEWWRRHTAEAIVLHGLLREEEAIHLGPRIDGLEEPTRLVLTSERDTAQALREAFENTERSGAAVGMRQPFAPSLDSDEPLFDAIAQPALPPRPASGDDPLRFDHSGAPA